MLIRTHCASYLSVFPSIYTSDIHHNGAPIHNRLKKDLATHRVKRKPQHCDPRPRQWTSEISPGPPKSKDQDFTDIYRHCTHMHICTHTYAYKCMHAHP